MSKRGDIIRGAGGYLKRNNKLGVGIGQPSGGDEGEIRVNLVDGKPRLYARAGGQWYSTGLEEINNTEFTIGKIRDHVKITPDGMSIIGKNKRVFDLDANKATLTLNQTAATVDQDEAGIVMTNDGAGWNRIMMDGANPELWMGYETGGGGTPQISVDGSSKINMSHGDSVNHLAVIGFKKVDDTTNLYAIGMAEEEFRIVTGGTDIRTDADCAVRISTDKDVRFGGDIRIANNAFFDAETANTCDSSGGSASATVDWRVSQKQKLTITGTSNTINFTDPAGPCNLLLKIIQGDGSDTITAGNYAVNVKWVGGAIPALSTGNGEIDIASFYFDGTSYHGVASLDFAAP